MAAVRDRHALMTHQTQTEANVKQNSTLARENLKKLYTSVKNAEEIDIGTGQDENTNMFLQLRGTRVHLQLTLENAFLEDAKYDTQKLDSHIIDIEKKFALKEESTLRSRYHLSCAWV